MEYGLRRYEAVQRLLWFLFFLICLALAYPIAGHHNGSPQPLSIQPKDIKSSSFWIELQGIRVKPSAYNAAQAPEGTGAESGGDYAGSGILVRAMIYILWAAGLFIAGRFLWLLVQHSCKIVLKSLLVSTINRQPGRLRPAAGGIPTNPERLFPAELLLSRVNRIPLKLLLHPFQRLRLMLTNPNGSISSEELIEKERRIVETDWQILWSSWGPFRWLLWCLPFLALMQSVWLFYIELQPALIGRRDIQEMIAPLFNSALPIFQAVVLIVTFKLASGLLKRMEELYLADVDSLIYDQFLSRLPFQSSDTLIVLEALQKHYQELQQGLRRLERMMGAEKEPTGRSLEKV